jgi:hypothetical protein
MTLTDAEYVKFVSILDDSQGNLPRDLSTAVSPAVRALTVGGHHEQGPFDIERLTTNEIASYPKGSSLFLRLISESA